jgi:integrase/recombinase XerD
LKVSVVKSLFSYATKIGYLNLNVTAALSAPSQVNALHERFLEQEEVRKLIGAAREGRDRSLLSLIYTTGLRASEALGIDWQDLQPRTNGGQVTVMGKGEKIRTVLINQSLWQQLTSLPRKEGTDAVFVTKFGNRLDRHQLHRIIKAAAERAGINSHVSAHWLRHTHACHSLEDGCDIDVLMRSLGHSSLTVTSKYLHARPNEGSSQFIDL